MKKSALLKLFAVPAAAFVIGVAEPVLADDEVIETPVETVEPVVETNDSNVAVAATGGKEPDKGAVNAEGYEGVYKDDNIEETVENQSIYWEDAFKKDMAKM